MYRLIAQAYTVVLIVPTTDYLKHTYVKLAEHLFVSSGVYSRDSKSLDEEIVSRILDLGG